MAERICRQTKFHGIAKLPGYKLVFSGKSPNWEMMGTANIVKDSSSEVWGVLYELEEAELLSLDNFEHVPDRRERKVVEVTDNKGTKIKAVIYLLHSDLDKNKPSQKYYELILNSALDVGLPRAYIDTIKKDR